MTAHDPNLGVWLVPLDGPRARAIARLSTADEASRAARRMDAVERARYLSHRGWLRVLLARQMGIGPTDVVLGATPEGRPYVPGSALRISAAHSGGFGLYAMTTARMVGVDLQWHDPSLQWRAVLRVFGSPREYAGVCSDVAGRGTVAFYDWWCRKEAVLKARGHGFRESLRAVPVEVPTAGETVHTGDGSVWMLHGLVAPRGFSAALAWGPVNDPVEPAA
jgi:4'-phosphopantetheinyl transferase